MTPHHKAARRLTSADAHEAVVAAALKILATDLAHVGDTRRGERAPAAPTEVPPPTSTTAAPWEEPAFDDWAADYGQANYSLRLVVHAWVRAAAASAGIPNSAVVERGIALALDEMGAKDDPVVLALVEKDLARIKAGRSAP